MAGKQSARKPRVLCVVPRGLEGRGGIERAFRYIANHGDAPAEFIFLATRGDGSRIASLLIFAKALMRFFWIAMTRQADVAHINLSLRASAYRKAALWAIAKMFGLPVIFHYHGGGFDARVHEKKLWISVTKFILRRAEGVIALGERWRQVFVDEVGVRPERVFVIYNAVPDFAQGRDLVRPVNRPLTIFFAGEIGARKGVDVLAEALSRLGKGVGWRCTIAGNGDVSPFREVLESGGVADRVTFPGWLGMDDIHAHMLSADILALPSRSEALPISLIEGAAAGAALVCTGVGASAEIAEHDVSGYVLAVEPAAFAHAFAELAQDRAKLAAMQSAARERYLDRFTFARMLERLGAAYAEVLDAKADGAAATSRPSAVA
jgi:glycosyltransferase involved in cell wall biosynthesis